MANKIKTSDSYFTMVADILASEGLRFKYPIGYYKRYQSGIHTMQWNDLFVQWLGKNRPELLRLVKDNDAAWYQRYELESILKEVNNDQDS